MSDAIAGACHSCTNGDRPPRRVPPSASRRIKDRGYLKWLGPGIVTGAAVFEWHAGLSRRLSDARGFYAVVAGSMLTGMVVGFAGLDPIRARYLAAIGNGLAAPPVLALLLLPRDRSLVGDFRSRALSLAIVGLALVISVALPLAYLVAR